MNKTEQLYEGKAKKVWATENPDVVIVDYKDDATAFNGKKKGTIVGKGVVNNKMSNYLMQFLKQRVFQPTLLKNFQTGKQPLRELRLFRLRLLSVTVQQAQSAKD